MIRILKICRQLPLKFEIFSGARLDRFILLTGVMLGLRLFETGCSPPAEPKNIILITIDALRADGLSINGNRYPTSPHLDRMAQKGVYFTGAISSSFCTQPAMASLMTGLFPYFEGVKRWNRNTFYGLSRFRTEGEKAGMTSNVKTLAEILQDAGYTTVGFNTNPYLLPKTNFPQGFQQYINFEDYFENAEELRIPLAYSCAAPVQLVMEKVLDWLNKDIQQPFFLWIHLMDIHFPYLPPEPYDRMFDWGFLEEDDLTVMKAYRAIILEQDWRPPPAEPQVLSGLEISKEELAAHLRGLYHGEVRLVDEYMGELNKFLEKSGLSKSTLLIVTSDHGEEFFEHEYLSHQEFSGCKDEMIKIPLIMLFPGSDKELSKKKIDNVVRMVDIAPTILDYIGCPEAMMNMDGTSLMPLIRGGSFPSLNVLISTLGLQLVRDDRWKYTWFKINKREELFDLKNDPGETSNLASERPEKVKEMKKLFQDFCQSIETKAPSTDGAFSEETASESFFDNKTKEILKTLGYAQ